tara:strand:+ start:1210 stop:2712 length:1503 start_codon:yes stop_codon:yes gene_type:complete
MPVGNAVQHSQGLRERGYSMATGGFFGLTTGSVAAQNNRFGQYVDTDRNHIIACGQMGDVHKSNAGETKVWYRDQDAWKYQSNFPRQMSNNNDRSASATITELVTGGSAGAAYAAIAHPYDDDQASNAGTICIWEKSCLRCDWIEMQSDIVDPVADGTNDTMGLSSMSLVGDTLAVGHRSADLDKDGANTVTSRGRVNIFVREGVTGAGVTGAVWASQQILDSGDNSTTSQFFGSNVRLNKTDNNLLAVSGLKLATDSGSSEGHVKVFQRSGTTWSLKATFKSSDIAASDQFGVGASSGRAALSFCGNTIVAGASGEDQDIDGNNTVSQAGSAYVFRALTGDYTQWTQVAKLTGPTRVTNDRFGDSVTHWQSGDQLRIAISAYGSELNGDDANDLTSSGTFANDGAVMIFQNTRDDIFECVSIIKRTNTSNGVSVSSGRGTTVYPPNLGMGSMSMNQDGILVVGAMNDSANEDGTTVTAVNNGSVSFYRMDWGVHIGELQ